MRSQYQVTVLVMFVDFELRNLSDAHRTLKKRLPNN